MSSTTEATAPSDDVIRCPICLKFYDTDPSLLKRKPNNRLPLLCVACFQVYCSSCVDRIYLRQVRGSPARLLGHVKCALCNDKRGFVRSNPIICRPLLTLLESRIRQVGPEDDSNSCGTATIQSTEQSGEQQVDDEIDFGQDSEYDSIDEQLAPTPNHGPFQIAVGGAGNPAVDGVYSQDGYFGFACRYTKTGRWNNTENVRFVINQCHVSNNTRHWYISILPDGGNPGTSSDIDFYTAPVTENCRTVPPATGWIKANEGNDPPPTMVFSEFDAIDGQLAPSTNDGPFQIAVEGAGNPVVNGIYSQDGFFGTARRYTKTGRWNNAEYRFFVFQCHVSNNTRHWYISIVPFGGNPGTSTDIDFYTAPVTEECRTVPPATGWIKANEGNDPPPSMVFIENDEAPTVEGDV